MGENGLLLEEIVKNAILEEKTIFSFEVHTIWNTLDEYVENYYIFVSKYYRFTFSSAMYSRSVKKGETIEFLRLTVEEHLWFYARLKGQQPESVQTQSEQMVVDLGNPLIMDQ